MRSMPCARMASSTSEVPSVFCSRSRRGCSSPRRTSALACRWNTVSEPTMASRRRSRVGDVARDHRPERMTLHAVDELLASGGEVVVHDDLDPVGQKPIGEVRADEPGSSGDERALHRLGRAVEDFGAALACELVLDRAVRDKPLCRVAAEARPGHAPCREIRAAARWCAYRRRRNGRGRPTVGTTGQRPDGRGRRQWPHSSNPAALASRVEHLHGLERELVEVLAERRRAS